MNVDCFYCLRYLLMVIISLNMLLGLTLLGASVWGILHGARMGQVLADTAGFNYILYFLMALGAAKFLIGFVGWCSVTKKNSRMLTTFFALVLILFLGQIAAGIWLYVDEDKVTEKAEQSLASFIQNDYEMTGYEAKTRALNVLQNKFECCGSNGPVDWSTSVYNEANENSTLEEYLVPTSCCIKKNISDHDHETFCEEARHVSEDILANSIYTEGCINRILKQIKVYGAEILGVVGGVILIELFVMSSTLILCRSNNVRYQL